MPVALNEGTSFSRKLFKQDENGVWIRYDFDKTYKLHQTIVWSMNFLTFVSEGFKDIKMKYHLDSRNWTKVSDVPLFAQWCRFNN